MSKRKTSLQGKADAPTAGEEGFRVPVSTQEMEEDFLEEIYRHWRDGGPMKLDDFAVESGESKTHMRSLVKKLVSRRYIRIDGEDLITLTDIGKMRGKECLDRHQKLTVFFQMITGMDEEEAEKDACRAEHTISRKAMDGIASFITHGDIYDRCYTNLDFSALYEPGEYEMAMSFYEIERRNPRILARERELFGPYACLEVEEDGSSRFRIRRKEGAKTVSLWYREKDGWTEVREKDGDFCLDTRLFDYTVSANFPITEGTLAVAVTERGKRPLILDSREINIHVV